jgi:hypothetical protein
MIVFDLACARGHVFEAWFGSSADFEDQRARSLVACPICGLDQVEKAVMAPNVTAKTNQRAGPDHNALPMRQGGPSLPGEVKAMLATMAKAQAKLLDGSENVGRLFADEARAIAMGEADDRPIHGQASVAEARALLDEGLPVMPLPLPIIPPDVTN